MNCCWPFKQCGHMFKRWSSVNPTQLLWYAPWVLKGSMYRVDSAAAARIYGQKHLRSIYPSLKQQSTQEWEAKSQEEEDDWRGTGPHRHLYPIPRGVLQSAGHAAMLKPSVGSLSRGHVKQDVCCGLTFHGPNYNIMIRWVIRLHFSLWWNSASIWEGDEWKWAELSPSILLYWRNWIIFEIPHTHH